MTDDTAEPGQLYLYKVQEVSFEGRPMEEYGPFAITGAGVPSDSVPQVQPQAAPPERVSADPAPYKEEEGAEHDGTAQSDWAPRPS